MLEISDSAKLSFFNPEGVEGLEIFTCSDMKYNFKRHFNESYCVWFNLVGNEKFYCKGNTSFIMPGEIGVVEPGVVHANISGNPLNNKLFTFYFYKDSLHEVMNDILDNKKIINIRTNIHNDSQFLKNLLTLNFVMKSKDLSIAKETCYIETIAELVNKFGVEKTTLNNIFLEKDRVKKMIDIFHDRYREDIKLEEISKELKCTKYYLIRLFKKSVGLSPHAYLMQLRLEKAKWMLKNGNNIIDTAIETGFADQSHMTRNFRQKFGLTPGCYIKQMI